MANPYDYVAYDEQAKKEQAEAKFLVMQLEDFLKRLGAKRVPYDIDIGSAQALAQVALQETYMWVGKQIRDNQIVRTGSAPLQEERGNS